MGTSTAADRRQRLATARVAVLGGGRSSEREISLLTQGGVVDALRGLPPERGPERVDAVEIARDGRWCVEGVPIPAGEALERLHDVDVYFLALHGGEGEDGTLQGLLDACDRAYTGSGVGASAVALDKQFARVLAADAGLIVPAGRVVSPHAWAADPEGVRRDLRGLADASEPTWFVKPRSGGSSVAMSRLRGRDALGVPLEQALAAVFAERDEALVEVAVEGTEVSVGVIPDPTGAPGPDGTLPARVLTPVEIRPHAGRFFDYEEKYSEAGARELCPPETVPRAVQDRLREETLAAHALFRCAGYSRTDFIVPEEGAPVFLETNTLPGLTARSLLPLEAAAEGIDYAGLCALLVQDGLARGARRTR